jgi:hypothetical protein
VSEAGGDPAFLSGEADQKRTARARHIAESVITSVRSEIQMILARRMGLMFKTWRTRLDTVVRPAHRKLEGVTILIDDRFQTIGGTISYPGDLTARLELRANCRCLMSFGTELPGGNR